MSLLTAAVVNYWNSKQALLVSGANIKTVNGVSILGSGDLPVAGTGSGILLADTYNPAATTGILICSKYNPSAT